MVGDYFFAIAFLIVFRRFAKEVVSPEVLDRYPGRYINTECLAIRKSFKIINGRSMVHKVTFGKL